jgi:hypothetical protein
MRRATPKTIFLGFLAVMVPAALALTARHVPSAIRAENDGPRDCAPFHDGSTPFEFLRRKTGRVHAPPVASLPERPGAAEKLFANGLAKDFGTVPRGTQLRYSFPITNVSAGPITIAHLQPSCGCLTAEAKKRNLRPHESATIDVHMDAGRFIGRADQNVRVKIVGPDFESTCKLRVAAVSGADVVIKPRELVFRNVVSGRESSQTVDVEYSGTDDGPIKEVQVDTGSPFTASLRSLIRQSGKAGYRLTVTLKADAPSGTTRSFVYLKSSDSKDAIAAIPVVAIVPRSVAAAPKSN